MTRWRDAETLTGFYATPGTGSATMVHVRDVGTRGPVCGSRIGPAREFQWCAVGVHWDFLECGSCIRVMRAREVQR